VSGVFDDGVPRVRTPEAPNRRVDPPKPRNSGLGGVEIVALVLPLLAIFVSAFIPWLVIRLPGLEREEVTLLELSGGRLLVILAAVLGTVGVGISMAKPRIGLLLVAATGALVGWFAGLAIVTVGLIRGLIPNITIVGVDLADGLIGQGPGVVVGLGAMLVLSGEIARWYLPSGRQGARFDVFGLAALALVVALAAASHSRWVEVRSDAVGSGIAISGDSLFGSVIVGMVTWTAAVLAVGCIVGVPRIRTRLVSSVLLAVVVLKTLQMIVLAAGSTFLGWLLPDKVGTVASTDLKAGLVVSAVATALSAGLAITGLIRGDVELRARRESPLRVLPGFGAVLASVVLLLVPVVAGPGGVVAADEEQPPSSTETAPVTTNGPPTTTAPAAASTPGEIDFARATAFVGIGDGTNLCAFGSGAFLGDGTYVITNEHVVATEGLSRSCYDLVVAFGNDPTAEPDSWYAATVVWSDEELDLAILKVADLAPGLTFVLEPRYDRLGIGEDVRVVGFPGIGGSTLTLTEGVISGLLRDPEEFYKVSADINRGNSGGPVLDTDGRLIGIATAGYGAEIDCESSSDCVAVGSSLGLVRPIDFARDAILQFVR
jgi:S1-C subfamily serine protease